MGSIKDFILFCVVTFSVTFAPFGPIYHSSAIASELYLLCLSFKTDVFKCHILIDSYVSCYSFFYVLR